VAAEIAIMSYRVIKNQDYGDVSARNTTRAPDNMQHHKWKWVFVRDR